MEIWPVTHPRVDLLPQLAPSPHLPRRSLVLSTMPSTGSAGPERMLGVVGKANLGRTATSWRWEDDTMAQDLLVTVVSCFTGSP